MCFGRFVSHAAQPNPNQTENSTSKMRKDKEVKKTTSSRVTPTPYDGHGSISSETTIMTREHHQDRRWTLCIFDRTAMHVGKEMLPPGPQRPRDTEVLSSVIQATSDDVGRFFCIKSPIRSFVPELVYNVG
ncbi:hypothetical protein HBI81_163580 [Parastagonospora nodorum]|nr:hypothetical protein HBH52_186640 [Parastagonospora nodorum]KAH4151613.1 hypothetical protein HBH43_239240 [Parastagonospora nodorum]KAH5057197.1 hypothetical protein HBI73_216530 [Parastagonospora nodorum]KAH5289361.1 hypothetical protein HBI11_228570 [Parastagonospora nodorum]KAH6253263.1 hypothetical protein HBI41_183210 [Parastagonospora nodorum]